MFVAEYIRFQYMRFGVWFSTHWPKNILCCHRGILKVCALGFAGSERGRSRVWKFPRLGQPRDNVVSPQLNHVQDDAKTQVTASISR